MLFQGLRVWILNQHVHRCLRSVSRHVQAYLGCIQCLPQLVASVSLWNGKTMAAQSSRNIGVEPPFGQVQHKGKGCRLFPLASVLYFLVRISGFTTHLNGLILAIHFLSRPIFRFRACPFMLHNTLHPFAFSLIFLIFDIAK